MNPQTYATTIRDAWRGSTAKVLEACKAAAHARADGCLHDVENQLAGVVDPSTLRRLAIIGECSHMYAAGVVDVLPPSWGTLYELTKLPYDQFAARLPEMSPTLMRKTVQGWIDRPARRGVPATRVQEVTLQEALNSGKAILMVDHREIVDIAANAARAGIPETLKGAVTVLGNLRKAGKPADYKDAVPAAQLRQAINFLQAIFDAVKP